MVWGLADEASALGSLVDRTFAEVAAAGARPRQLDREFLTGQFDLWADHLFPAAQAAAAPLHRRRPAARAVWRSLGSAAGAQHRHWLAAHLDGCGLDATALLGPERLPLRQPLTPEAVEQVTAAYDLAGGTVEVAGMEVGAAPGAVRGYVRLSARAAGREPQLSFETAEATALTLFGADRPTVSVGGAAGLRTGRPLSFWTDDPRWRALHNAGAEEPRPAPPETRPLPAGPVDQLVAFQLMICTRLRLMRQPGLLRRTELVSAGARLAGLGAELFRVRPASLRNRAAARRWQSLMESDDPLVRLVGRRMGFDRPGPAGPAPVRITVATAGHLLDDLDVTGARLRLVEVTAAQTVLHLDVRRREQDTVVVVVLTGRLDSGPFTVRADGLDLTGRPVLAATADDVSLTLGLPGGDWTLRAAAGSCYVD